MPRKRKSSACSINPWGRVINWAWWPLAARRSWSNPPDHTEFGGFTDPSGVDHSRFERCRWIDAALALIPPDGSGRLLVLSDGQMDGRRDPAIAAARARGFSGWGSGGGLSAHHAAIGRAIWPSKVFQTPSSVLPGRGVCFKRLECSRRSDQDIQYELKRGELKSLPPAAKS